VKIRAKHGKLGEGRYIFSSVTGKMFKWPDNWPLRFGQDISLLVMMLRTVASSSKSLPVMNISPKLALLH